MTFYGKYILFVSTIVQATLIICFPHSYDQFDYSGKNYPKNYITNAFQSNQIINTEPICSKFHFPETEYPLASISDIPFNFREIEKKMCFKTQISTNSQLKSNPKNYINMNYNNHDIETLSNRHANDFLSSSRNCDIVNFPDIEYPMSASELWKPYYWGCQNNFQTSYTDQPSRNLKFNHTTTRKDLSNNFGKLSTRRKTLPVSNKSFSDLQKNVMMLKNNQQNKNITIQKYNESIKFVRHEETVCKTTETQLAPFNKSRTLHPNYHMQIIQSNSVAENKSINNFDSIHRISSILPEKEKFHNISLSEMENVNSDYKLKATENAMKSYTERFNTQMSGILKNIADKIVLNGHNQVERNILDSPNIYLVNYGDDSFYEIPTENDVTLYANEFNNKMTSIIKSVADNIFLKNTDSPNINMYTNASDAIEECFKSDIETTVKDSEKSINTYADRFNNEMSSVLNSNFEDIILDDVNFMKENSLHSNINCPLKNEEVCRTTDLFDLRNRTLPKQKSGTILVLDDSHQNSEKETFTNVRTKHDNSYEDYTTDAYPESDNSWSLYSQSTVVPEISSVDTTWKSSKVIEPDNACNSEELGQYFMLV